MSFVTFPASWARAGNDAPGWRHKSSIPRLGNRWRTASSSQSQATSHSIVIDRPARLLLLELRAGGPGRHDMGEHIRRKNLVLRRGDEATLVAAGLFAHLLSGRAFELST